MVKDFDLPNQVELPLVSICIPAYSSESTLGETLDAVLAQDYSRLDVVGTNNIDKCGGQAFNIGAGMDSSLSLLELFTLLEDLLGTQLTYEKLPWRHSDQKIFVADISKAKEIGWHPKIDLKDGISRMIEWKNGLSHA